jgi:hypothetical protein
MTKARENSDYTGLAADITAGDTAARAGRKNWIINGSVIVSQRASYATAVSIADYIYYQDRWTTVINGGVAATIQTKSTDQPNGQVGNCIRIITSAGSAAAECCVDQRIENPQQFAGKTVTFSVWMKSNTNKAGISHFNNQDTFVAPTNHTGGGAWEKLTLTHTVNATGPTDFRLRLGMSQSGNTVVGVGDYFEVTEAQMEYGSVATDFEHRSYGEELQLCKRYYQDSGFIKYLMGGRWAASTGGSIGWWKWAVAMRAAPSVTTSGTWSTGLTYGGTPAFSNMTTAGTTISTSGITFPTNTVMYFNNGYIQADAEL